MFFVEYLAINETYFSHCFSMFEVKAREYFQGASDHFPVPAIEVPETVRLVLSMELLAIHSISEVGVKTKFIVMLP